MKVLIVVSAFLLVQVYGNAINAKCEPDRFTRCTDTFARALGLPSMPTDASVLDQQIKKIEARGKQGQMQVCKAAEALQSCLGQEYGDCMSVAFLKSIGESDKDAKQFVVISQQLQKQCVQISMINEKCDSELFDKCTTSFARALGLPQMPTDASVLDRQIEQIEAKGKQGEAQVCKAAGNLQDCLGQEYNDCISVAYLKSIGESDKDAKQFVAISKQLEQQCAQIQMINEKCDSGLFDKCTTSFARALGLPQMPTDASVLDRQIKQIEAKGRQGQQQVCKAAKNLQDCLGEEYNDCISVAYLKSIGESDKDAKQFVAISKQLEQQCAQISMVNEKCDSELFEKCTTSFARALGLPQMPTDASVLDRQIKQIEAKGKQGKAQVCKAAGNLQDCLGQEYNDCISVAYLKSIGESDKDAKQFVAISKQLEQQCAQISMVNAKCEHQLFTKCTETFAKALGLGHMPTDASVLDNRIKQIEAKGKEGKALVCKAAGNLQDCLGQEYNDCMSVAFLKSIGESDRDAKQFVAISKQLEQQCAQIQMINAKCDSQLFTKCTNMFAQALSLPSMPTDADVLINQIEKLEAKGTQGKEQVCGAEVYLKTCLAQQYDDCISVEYLKSIGESDKDAQEFVDISNQLQKQCTQIQMITAKCEVSLVQKCGNNFAQALGLPSAPQDPSVLEKQIEQIEAKGKQGQIQVCNADKALQKCLGAEYRDCTSVAFLESMGLSEKDAKEFEHIARDLEITCA
jgi:hypothetical protein